MRTAIVTLRGENSTRTSTVKLTVRRGFVSRVADMVEAYARKLGIARDAVDCTITYVGA
jgi:hypothetical protein